MKHFHLVRRQSKRMKGHKYTFWPVFGGEKMIIKHLNLHICEEGTSSQDQHRPSPEDTRGSSPHDDGPPDDIRAFFGHPLTAATTAINGEDTSASAAALLHEYINLPALDKSGMKIGDTIHSLYDIMRADDKNGDHSSDQNGIDTNCAAILGRFLQQTTQPITTESQAQLQATIQSAISNHTASSVIKKSKTRSRNKRSVTQNEQSSQPENQVTQSVCKDSSSSASVVNCNNEPPESELGANDCANDGKSLSAGDNSVLYKDSHLAETCRLEIENELCQNKITPQKSEHSDHKTVEQKEILTKNILKALTEKLRKNKSVQNSQQDVQQNEISVSTISRYSSESTVSLPENSEFQQSEPSSPKSQAEEQKFSETPAMAHGMTMTLPMATTSLSSIDIPVHSIRDQCYSNFPDMRPIQIVAGLSDLTTEQDMLQHQVHQQPMRQNSYPVTTCNSVNYDSNTYMYAPSVTPPNMNQTPTENGFMLERYIQQQQYYHEHQSPNYGAYGLSIKDSYSMKSPDSGINEPSLSPDDQMNLAYNKENNFVDTQTSCQKVTKRRKSAPAVYQKPFWPACEKLSSFSTVIPKLDASTTGYKYTLETPISTACRIEEDRVTYLNKGQYYGLTVEFNGDHLPQSNLVKSVIMVVFRDDKSLEDERKAWEFWHSRQHSHKQRVIDIDTKDSQGVQASNITELAFNAVAVRWNPRDSPIKVNVAVHCLSTDFSNQKGVKGLPLHIQIDTFENLKDTYPVDRGYCQIKVFCDKGAERKTRDEEKRRLSRVKAEGHPAAGRKRLDDEMYHAPCDRSEFYTMSDTRTFPVLFTPVAEQDEINKKLEKSPVHLSINGGDDDGNSSLNSIGDSFEDTLYPPFKRQRRDSYSGDYSKVLLYVREQHETVYTALMLRMPTLHGLLQAVEEKYNIPVNKVKSIYKKSKKGILVRMDDNIVRHYSHESTFIIEMTSLADGQEYEIILSEIDITH